MTKHSAIGSTEVAAKSKTTTDEQGFHEAKDGTCCADELKDDVLKDSCHRHRVVLW